MKSLKYALLGMAFSVLAACSQQAHATLQPGDQAPAFTAPAWLAGEGFSHWLDTPHQPFDFSGDTPVECSLIGQIAFDAALFGTAANNGQMIAEVSANSKANEVFSAIGMQVTGRQVSHGAARPASLLGLPALFRKRA